MEDTTQTEFFVLKILPFPGLVFLVLLIPIYGLFWHCWLGQCGRSCYTNLMARPYDTKKSELFSCLAYSRNCFSIIKMLRVLRSKQLEFYEGVYVSKCEYIPLTWRLFIELRHGSMTLSVSESFSSCTVLDHMNISPISCMEVEFYQP
jgi:hypothetical protein